MRAKYKLSCAMASVIVAVSVFADTQDALSHNGHSPVLHDFETEAPNKSHKIIDFQALQPRVVEAKNTSEGVHYIFHNGETLVRTGGSIAWRNNNPGCIRYYNKGNFGAIGSANRFAIFPDEITGMRAIKSLLLSDSYRNLTIANAIYIYAPPHENNTERYINSLCGLVGVSRTTKLCDLNDTQLDCVVHTIRRLEGWIIGTEKFIPSQYNVGIKLSQNDIHNRLNEFTLCWFFDHSI